MKWIFVIFGMGVVFVLGFYFGQTSRAPEPADIATTSASVTMSATNLPTYEWYPVVKVIDGDTLTINMNGENITVRLIGLDTPETVDPRKPVQCFGREASEKARKILSGKSVRIETDPSQGELDKYGRTLAYVLLPDGKNFAELMISEGYGHEYTYNLPYKYQAEFKAAEKSAREQKKGLWADGACAPSAPQTDADRTQNDVEINFSKDSSYECSRNVYNCSDFTTQAEAQAVFESCGGSSNDIHKLDADGDSRVCESLP